MIFPASGQYKKKPKWIMAAELVETSKLYARTVARIEPQWLEEHLPEVQVVDVRDVGEFDGVLGHIATARLFPLGELQAHLGDLAADRPIVTVCRSGSRSARAAVVLEQNGFPQVANLSGGMLRWRSLRLPVAGAVDGAA